MRDISSASLAKLATRFGTEPINILEVDWVDGSTQQYADRDIPDAVQGKIQTIGELDNVVGISLNTQTQQISITLDDTDGSIKAIIDQHDIHKRPARLYQWFEGLDLGESFLIFQGLISSPITWNEGDRTVSFTLVSKLEDRQCGFSAEEGAFAQIPEKLVGQPWPMLFGTPLNVPALAITDPLVGTITHGVGIHDYTIEMQRSVIATQHGNCNIIALIFEEQRADCAAHGDDAGANDYKSRESQALTRMSELATESANLKTELDSQMAQEAGSVTILNGEKYPQGVSLRLDINSGIFTGSFTGNVFNITAREHPQKATKTDTPHITCSLQTRIPATGPRELVNYTEEVTGSSASWFWAECGSRAKLADAEPIDHIVSIVPGTVLSVSAKRAFEGIKQLVTVPPSYYTVFTQDFGDCAPVMVRLNKPLSSYTDEGWEDQIYITFQSSVGPNTVDILAYLIETYTPELAIDAASFNHVRERLALYPSSFAILDKKNVVQVLQEIARQCRCAIWLDGDTFFLRYLSEKPTPTISITQSDIVPKSMEVFHTNTEDLITSVTCEWKPHYAVDNPNKVVLKYNVKTYGTQERTDDYYIYNVQDYVVKSATFWMIREANTWKKVRFSTFLHKLQLEAFDPVTLNFSKPYVSSAPITGIVETANYDSASNQIKFEVWTPVKAGTMVPYNFAFPADISETDIFPTVVEEGAGVAGGDNPFKNSNGVLMIGQVGASLAGAMSASDTHLTVASTQGPFPSTPFKIAIEAEVMIVTSMGSSSFTVTRGADDTTPVAHAAGTLVTAMLGSATVVTISGYRSRQDHGGKYPSDKADKALPPPPLVDTGQFDKTDPKLKTPDYKANPYVPGNTATTIDIRKTIIADSANNETARLDSFFIRIKDKKLQMDKDAMIATGTYFDDKSGVFDFKYDDTGKKYGAGTAFLQETVTP